MVGADGAERLDEVVWTVVDGDYRVVAPADGFLRDLRLLGSTNEVT
jgi:hypothetical protein